MLPVYCKDDRLLFERTLFPFFTAPEKLPVRYKIGENEYTGMPARSRVERNDTAGKSLLTYSAEAEGLLLTAQVTLYTAFAAAEWKLTVSNPSDREIRLSDLTAADLVFPGERGRVLLCNGDFYSFDGYVTTEHEVTEEPIYSAPSGGRACDRAFPYQRLLFDGYGYNIAIGWPGQWYSRQTSVAGGVRFEAGQETFDAVLRPGETVRTPLMAVVAFVGGLTRGINVWRRWYLEYVMPRPHGAIVKPFLSGNYAPPGTIEFSEATEENQISTIRRVRGLGVDLNLWWLDAGWYECKTPEGTADWWAYVGDWTCDLSRFPHGLAPVGDTCREEGMEFLMWYESERVTPNTRVVSEHPEWLIKSPDGEVILLNLGIPACREYLSKKIGDSLAECHTTVYRQDYNLEPLPVWQLADEENRRGMTENLYLQGYLRFWDDLLERFPDLVIDSCASGGRRNDLETMRRAVVMHETDSAYGNHPVLQGFFYTLYSWIPYFRGFNESWEDENGEYMNPDYYNKLGTTMDDYQLYASIAPMTTMSGLIKYLDSKSPEEVERCVKFSGVFHRVAPLLETGDFYPLTPYHKSREQWTVFQFDKPEEKKGLLQVIRNNAAQDETKTVRPCLTQEGTYTFTHAVTGESFTRTREELERDGLTFAMPMRSAALWEYTVE